MSNWKLIVTNPSHGSQEYPLDPARRYTVGRSNADVDLGFEPAASRKHATLEWSACGWRIIDEISANGTRVNGKSVNVANMEPGVVALVGTTSLTVQAAGVATYASPTTTSPPPVAASAVKRPEVGPANAAKAPLASTPMPDRPKRAAKAGKSAHPEAMSSNTGALIGVGVTVVVLIIGIAVAMSGSGGGAAEPEPEKKQPIASTPSGGSSNSSSPAQSISQRLDVIERDGEPERALSELDQLYAVAGRRFTTEERTRYDRIRKVAESKVRSSVVVLQRKLNADLKELLQRQDYVKAWAALEAADNSQLGRSPVYSKAMQEAGLTAEIAAKRAEVTAGSEALYKLMLSDAFTSEQIGSVAEAISIVKSIPDRVLIDAEKQAFLDKRLAQLETNPNVIKPRKRDWKPATGVRPPWDPLGRPSLNDPNNPDNPSGGAPTGGTTVEKPSDGKAPDAKKVLPPNPLFPHGRLTQEQLMFGVLETIRVGIEDNKLQNKLFRRAKQTFEIQSADEKGIRLKDGESGLAKTYDWGWFSVGEYDGLLARLDGINADTLLGLSLIALDRKDDDSARKLLIRMLGMDASRKAGADNLLASYEGRDSIPEGGYVEFEGSLFHPENLALLMFERKVAGLLAVVEKGLGAKEKSTAREKGEAAFKEILALGPDAAAPTVKLLQKLRETLLAEAEAATGLAGDTKALDVLFAELEKRRKHALELIFNEKEWPYPYGPNNAEVTAEVMKRVAAVREIWTDPASVKGVANPKFDEVIAKIKDLNGRLDTVDPSFTYHEASNDADLEYLQAIANQRLNIQKYGKSRGDKTKLGGWWKIIEENDAVQKAHADKPEAPDREAWEQLRITNDYRMMMGRHPLRMSFKLYWAAKHHSQWCVERNGGQISHDSPGGPRGNNVPERCSHEGYSSGTGENIHMNGGGPSAQSSHDSWLHSSGHHRNILSLNWVVMGNGVFQTIWTQNFGSADEGKGNQESKGGK